MIKPKNPLIQTSVVGEKNKGYRISIEIKIFKTINIFFPAIRIGDFLAINFWGLNYYLTNVIADASISLNLCLFLITLHRRTL